MKHELLYYRRRGTSKKSSIVSMREKNPGMEEMVKVRVNREKGSTERLEVPLILWIDYKGRL